MATQASTCMYFDDANEAIAWFEKVAQFEICLRIDGPDGKVQHSELALGPICVMIGSAKKEQDRITPTMAGGTTGSLYIVMKDEAALRAHYEHAKAHSPNSIDKDPFTTDYGSVDYSLKHQGQVLFLGTYAPHMKKSA